MLKKEINISQISDEQTTHPEIKQEKISKRSKKDEIKGIFEKKITKNIPLLACVSEKSACLVFLNENGTVDSNEVLWSKDQKFLSWCNDFFDYYWNIV